MQNNVTELTQKLLRSLDSNYNVIDMPAVIDIIALLEKVSITKELLETTRLGKHINELRRKTTNDSLSKRAKGLLKIWRSKVLPESNGQLKTSPPLQQQKKPKTSLVEVSPPLPAAPKLSPTLPENAADVNLNQIKAKKRPAKEPLESVNAKRARVNGVTDLDFSDNSNSSFKDVIPPNLLKTTEITKRDVIVINSDSNSSFPDNRVDPQLEPQMPKKRGRKKGSKNHKNLIDEAESSFTNKLAVSASRGNSKVKTTQELLASIQNKNAVMGVKPKEDLIEKAAKLTERVQVIDQKLNTNANRNKSSQKGKLVINHRNERVLESGSVINDKSLLNNLSNEDEIVVVDDIEPEVKVEENDETETRASDIKKEDELNSGTRSLTVEEALALLPPVDKSVLYQQEDSQDEPQCTCYLKENKPGFSIDEDEEAEDAPRFEFIEDESCPAKKCLSEKYHMDNITNEMVHRLHTTFINSVNGICSLGGEKPDPPVLENGLYVNVVPNYYEKLDKDMKYFNSDDYKKYRVSKDSEDSGIVIKSERVDDERTEEVEDNECNRNEGNSVFREWYELAEKPSYNGEVLKILPYTIID